MSQWEWDNEYLCSPAALPKSAWEKVGTWGGPNPHVEPSCRGIGYPKMCEFCKGLMERYYQCAPSIDLPWRIHTSQEGIHYNLELSIIL